MVDDLARTGADADEADRVLGRLEREPGARAFEDPVRDGVEDLGARVAVRGRRVSESEPRGHQLHVDARPDERRCELVVVLRGERRWVDEKEAHWPLM